MTGNMILHIENPKNFTQKVLYPINEFSKIAGYKINSQKSLTLLYMNNEILKMECKKYLLKLHQKILCTNLCM